MWNLFERINRRFQPVIGGIDQTWSHDGCVGVRGWLVHRKGPLDRAEIEVDGQRVPITNWHPRPDVARLLPGLTRETLNRCGFWAQVPRTASHRIILIGSHGQSEGRVSWVHKGSEPASEGEVAQEARHLFGKFIEEVNRNRLHVLEIGSRIVAPGSSSKRPLFKGCASYTGFDYYDDDNTDVVGDAHRLGEYFESQRFDAVFSYSVLEHLAMPWLLSAEVNKVLKTGGITFHHTHFAWPLHEQPWDFWRFTDAGLRVLFSRPLGFEVLESGMFEPIRMYMDVPAPGMESFSEHTAFGGSVILAKKISEISDTKGLWGVSTADVVEGSVYPEETA